MKTVFNNEESEILVKKSKFIGHIYKVSSKEEAEQYILELKKKYFDAKHNCYVYRVYSKNGIIEKASDDGEPSQTAGAPMMDILKKQDIINCLIVVTRYFGGILLGTGGLVKAYSDSAKECIENAKLKEVKVGSLIEYEIKYEELQKLQYICNKQNINIVDVQYGENILVKINIEKELIDIVESSISIIKKNILEEEIIF